MHKFKNNVSAYQSNIGNLITSFFAQFKVLVGKPLYKTLTSSNKFVVQIPYFVPAKQNTNTVTESQLCLLGSAITQIFNKTQSPAMLGKTSGPTSQ